MDNMRCRRVMRYDRYSRIFRVTLVVWECGAVGDGRGYSAKLSIGLRPAILAFRREEDGWIATVCGLRLHYRRSYGGRFA